MNKTKVIAGALFLAVLAFVGVIHFMPKSDVQQAFAAITGPDISSSYLNWGGVRMEHRGVPLTQNASTTCAILSPAATSTLAEFGIKLDTASSSATIWEIGQSAGPDATTTLIGTKYNVAASAQAFIHASTSPAAGAAEVFAPNTWLNVKQGGGITSGDAAGTGFVPTGRCQAEFEVYPTI